MLQVSDSFGNALAKQLDSLSGDSLRVDLEPLGIAAEVEEFRLIVGFAATVVGFGLDFLLFPPWTGLMALPIPIIVRTPPQLAVKWLAVELKIRRDFLPK